MSEQQWARHTAVAIHDQKADWFAGQYHQGQDCFESGFLYGRCQIHRFFQKIIHGLAPGAKILDVGCGTGEQLAWLHSRGFEVFGVEPSALMRQHAEARTPAGAVMAGTVLDLPFAGDSFDFIYAIEVFRYLTRSDNIAGLREIYRTLKPGGIFFGTFVNRYALDGFGVLVGLRKILERIFRKGRQYHTEFETPSRLRETLQNVGFATVETYGAMIPLVRVLFKISKELGKKGARLLQPLEPAFTEMKIFRPLAGHLIGIGKK